MAPGETTDFVYRVREKHCSIPWILRPYRRLHDIEWTCYMVCVDHMTCVGASCSRDWTPLRCMQASGRGNCGPSIRPCTVQLLSSLAYPCALSPLNI